MRLSGGAVLTMSQTAILLFLVSIELLKSENVLNTKHLIKVIRLKVTSVCFFSLP